MAKRKTRRKVKSAPEKRKKRNAPTPKPVKRQGVKRKVPARRVIKRDAKGRFVSKAKPRPKAKPAPKKKAPKKRVTAASLIALINRRKQELKKQARKELNKKRQKILRYLNEFKIYPTRKKAKQVAFSLTDDEAEIFLTDPTEENWLEEAGDDDNRRDDENETNPFWYH